MGYIEGLEYLPVSNFMPNIGNLRCAYQGRTLINRDTALADGFPTSVIIKWLEIFGQVGISIRLGGNRVHL